MCKKGEQIVLDLPDFVDKSKKNRTISADKCSVNVLKHLWANGIETLSHCCGHGERNPSIIIQDGYILRDSKLLPQPVIGIEKIMSLIKEVDNRQWEIFQWQLIQVNKYKLREKIQFWFRRIFKRF